jgi:predicted metal-dependent hydrolase
MAAPLLLGLISDLFFAVQIENAAKALSFRVQWIEQDDGSDGPAFIARVVECQPALIVLELNSTALPWAKWVSALKSSPATRRIPVLAFGPHTDAALRQRAEDVGCDVIVTKGQLVNALPELIQKHARLTDASALADACAGELSPLAVRGIELFNQREFFEAHEALEHAWKAEPGPARELYRGLLQVAVAYLQIERRNYSGALKMFLRLRQWLDPLPDECRGVDVAQLRAEAIAARAALERLGPDRLAEFDVSLFKPVAFQR